MDNIFDIFTNPAVLVIIAAFLGVLKAVGELLIKLGNMGRFAAKDNDPLDSMGAFCLCLVDGLGKLLAFFAPGNRQKIEK